MGAAMLRELDARWGGRAGGACEGESGAWGWSGGLQGFKALVLQGPATDSVSLQGSCVSGRRRRRTDGYGLWQSRLRGGRAVCTVQQECEGAVYGEAGEAKLGRCSQRGPLVRRGGSGGEQTRFGTGDDGASPYFRGGGGGEAESPERQREVERGRGRGRGSGQCEGEGRRGRGQVLGGTFGNGHTGRRVWTTAR